MDTGLLSLFTENIIVALENIRLNEVIGDNQREIIYRIGELVESRSKESGLARQAGGPLHRAVLPVARHE